MKAKSVRSIDLHSLATPDSRRSNTNNLDKEIAMTVNELREISLKGLRFEVATSVKKSEEDPNPYKYTVEYNFDKCSAADLLGHAIKELNVKFARSLRSKDKSKWPRPGRVEVEVGPSALAPQMTPEDRVVAAIGVEQWKKLEAKGMTAVEVLEQMKAFFGIDESSESSEGRE